jgi:hypothetical protein
MSAPEREKTACKGSGGSWSQLASTTAIVLPLEVGDAVYGYPAPARKALDRRPLGQRTKGRRRKRRPDGVSRTLGNGRIPWVLVDNKSAAEIGKRCLLLIGGQRPRAVSVR